MQLDLVHLDWMSCETMSAPLWMQLLDLRVQLLGLGQLLLLRSCQGHTTIATAPADVGTETAAAVVTAAATALLVAPAVTVVGAAAVAAVARAHRQQQGEEEPRYHRCLL